MSDIRADNGVALIEKIQEELAYTNDGPYVFHGSNKVTIYTIRSSRIEKEIFQKNNVLLIPHTDIHNKKFTVKLKSSIQQEPSQFNRPENLFVLSDIEGNFDALRKLLIQGKVIDEDFNWTFGKGHLIFTGDMFDRGKQVTECLWLIYSLEEKARSAGGYVHFILGNHEIMNLNGDLRYVDQKYKNNASLMGLSYDKLYGRDTELGKWLRSKNVIEKIGDILFVHGGITRELNKLALSLEEINRIVRYNLNIGLAPTADTTHLTIHATETSPFWYRGYYMSDASYKTPESVIDSTLNKFNVSKIITGHTMVSDIISTHYRGKVINTDTEHNSGLSEALLIEGSNYYRINTLGKKETLFNKTPSFIAKKGVLAPL